MLILTRKAGEALKIGDEIAVTVIEIKGSHVRLGIEAPQGIRICRMELGEPGAGGRGPARGPGE